MNILERIIEKKKQEVALLRKGIPTKILESSDLFGRKCYSLTEFLAEPARTGIIAEFKRRSPSKGDINTGSSVEGVTASYERYGASAISVLTDQTFFGGSLKDLGVARRLPLPILRKDFVIDEYQLLESKAWGADAILLIAACLTKEQVKKLTIFAKNLGLEVLLELHSENEFDHISSENNVIGINNRNLKDFQVDVNHSIHLAGMLPPQKIKIAESGIHDAGTCRLLKKNGFDGFLIGEMFMKTTDPGREFKNFAEALRKES